MEIEIDKDFALLYGIMLGDGCLSQSGRHKFIAITGSSQDDLPFFKEVIHPILRKYRAKDTNIKFKKDCNAIEYNFVDNKLFNFFVSTGFPIGKKGNRLFIPKIFYDLNLVNQIISGFFATDGSLVLTKNPNKYYPRLEVHVISKDLLYEIYTYLLSKGLRGAFYTAKRINDSRPWKNTLQPYRVQFNGINNLLLFNELIGFSNPKYKEKFKHFINYSSDYDFSINGLQSKDVKPISLKKNEDFNNKMALGRIELPVSSS